MKTILDTQDKIYNYITSNMLDKIWVQWSNPIQKNSNLIRCNGYNPIFNETNKNIAERNGDFRCSRFIDKKAKIQCSGYLKIPEDDINRGIIAKVKCSNPTCPNFKTVYWRWRNRTDRTKLYFDSPQTVKYYAKNGRSFYSTITIHDQEILNPHYDYTNEKFLNGVTLGIDIDNTSSNTIIDPVVRERLQATIDLFRSELDTFVPNSYNLQTSGNGIYFFIHHLLCDKDIRMTMSKFNGFIDYVDQKRIKEGIKGIAIDSLNKCGQLFKMFGSPHQRYDLACIALPFDIDLTKMDTNKFKLENFNVKDYINVDTNKLEYYNRVDKRERDSLYKFLDEYIKRTNSGHRAMRYQHKDIPGETIKQERMLRSLEDELIIEERLNNYKHLDMGLPSTTYIKETEDNYILQIHGDYKLTLKEFKKRGLRRT